MGALVYLIPVLVLFAVLKLLLSGTGGSSRHRGGGHGGVGHGGNGPHHAGAQPPPNTIYPFKRNKPRKRSWWRRRRSGRHSGRRGAAPGVPTVPERGFGSAAEEQRFQELCRNLGYAYDAASGEVYEDPHGEADAAESGFGGVVGFFQMCAVIALLMFLFSKLPWN